MECCQAVRSASRSIRPSLLQGQIMRQQQRFQSSSSSSSPPQQPTPSRSAIDSLLASRRNTAPVSRPSILSSPRGAGLSAMLPPRPPRAGTNSSSPFNSPNSLASSRYDFVSQIDQDHVKYAEKKGIQVWSVREFEQKTGLTEAENLRMSPSVGRMTYTSAHVDASRAIDLCNRMAARNGLRNMSLSQKFHERKALRRKRKLREAWRARFKVGFKAAVNRAMELRRQGW